MSDVDTRFEKLSFVLNELRDESNNELISLCLGELEKIQRKVQEGSREEKRLLEYCEKQRHEAEKIIRELEDEIDDLKANQPCLSPQKESNILVERSVFWKDHNNVPENPYVLSPTKNFFSPTKMQNMIFDMELKTLQSEKENQRDKLQIKQLEDLTEEYAERIEELEKNLEELREKDTKNMTKIKKLISEKNKYVAEISQLKSDEEFFKMKVADLEKDVYAKAINITQLEAKMKTLEDRNGNLTLSIEEIFKENQALTSERKEFEENFQITFKEIKEKTFLRRSSPELRKLLVSYNKFAQKSPIPSSKRFATPQESTRQTNSVENASRSQKTRERECSSRYRKQNLENISKFQEKFEDENQIMYSTLDEYLHCSNEKTNCEREFDEFVVNDICRHELSDKVRSGFSVNQEEDESVYRPEGPLAERIITSKKNPEVSVDEIKKGKLRYCLADCNIF